MKRGRYSDFIADLITAWTPFLAVFIALPIAIYVPNQIEFAYNISIVLTLSVIGVAFLIALLPLYLIKPDLRARISHGLFFLGLFVFLSDLIAPPQWARFDGQEKLTEPLAPTLLQAVLAILLILLWIKLPTDIVRRFGACLTLTVFAFQPLALLRALPEAVAATNQLTHISPDAVRSPANLPNIYQFVFDGYSSLNFLGDLSSLDLARSLDSFVFFPRNLANYNYTDASVPSFLTGRLFKAGSFKDFQRQATTSGIRRELHKLGYQIALYTPDKSRFWAYAGARDVTTGEQLAGEVLGDVQLMRLMQVTLVRVAPNWLRLKTLEASNGFLEQIADSYYKFSVPLIKRFIADEEDRPALGRYVYVHVILPHPPLVWNEKCEPVETRSDYRSQSLCAVRLMGEIVHELKSLGRYENSMIIFQSDHGIGPSYIQPTGELAYNAASPEVRQRIQSIKDVDGDRDPDDFLLRLHALLAIKPPMSEHLPMVVSPAQTQLADIAATIYGALGLEGVPTDGQSVFALSEEEVREIHTFVVSNPNIAHLSFTRGQGWRIYPSFHSTD